jgi:bifunctional non-homologous end joining protein LigD
VSLTEYQRKRDFKRTPEPKGKPPKETAARRYVVHRHHATRLHWDVRLEMRGILASWAVTQGPPLEAGKRRLAVHTEDHPLEYLTFHGVIPDGYGAGSMTIWDEGTYDLLKDSPNEYKVDFHGKRLQGEWVLVQTKQNEGRDWLMIKHGTAEKGHPLDAKIQPMLAITADEPFDSPEFAFEPKWDGVRTIAFVDGGIVRLQTRNLLDCTSQYPEAHGVSEALTGAYQAILDGEIVALDEKGAPSFQRLQPRMHQRDESELRRLRKTTPVIYEVFDILWADGEDLTKKPLRERQQILDEVLTPMGAVRRSEQFVGTGRALFSAAQEQGLEGIVAKRLDSPYATARSAAWVKIKAFKTMDCVVGGWTEGQGGRAQGLGALLIGIYKEGRLTSVGHVGSGFDERTLKGLLSTLKQREVAKSPFAAEVRANTKPHWCAPELVCEVRYVEMTRDGTLRAPSYRGLRADVDPLECTGEERRESTKNALKAAARASSESADGDGEIGKSKGARVPALLTIDGHNIRLTNLEKVIFPEDGYTKADLIRYYTEVSPFLIPVIHDRPLTMKLFPDGIAAMHFYQKDKPEFTPRWVSHWVDHTADREGGIDYVLGNDLATLIWLANYTAIEIHPWLARIDDPEHPDIAIIDLDPSVGATWDDVKETAQLVHSVLDDLGLRGYPKTTGSRGIHIYVPIARRYTFEESRGFVFEVGKIAREKKPTLVTLETVKDRRRGVYIDYLQNVGGKTTAGAYSVRPIRRAPVSAPLEWDEISSLGRPDAFTIRNMSARLAETGDLLAGMLDLEQKLPRASVSVPAKPTRAAAKK